jgi:hypothetical protein
VIWGKYLNENILKYVALIEDIFIQIWGRYLNENILKRNETQITMMIASFD